MNKNGCGNCLLMYIIYYSRNWQHLLGSSMLPWPLFAIVFAPDIVADNKEPDSVYDNGYQNRRRRPHPSQCVTLGVTGGLCGVALATKGRARVLRGSGLPETGFEAWNGPRWVCIHTYHNIKYMMYVDVLVPTRKKKQRKLHQQTAALMLRMLVAHLLVQWNLAAPRTLSFSEGQRWA